MSPARYNALYYPNTNTGVYGAVEGLLKPLDAQVAPPGTAEHSLTVTPMPMQRQTVGHVPCNQQLNGIVLPRHRAMIERRRREILVAHSQMFASGYGAADSYHVF
eukprot:2945854-Rhodomonas_salina.1